jgi:ferrous iron transport protein B
MRSRAPIDDRTTAIALVGNVGEGKTTLWRRLGGKPEGVFAAGRLKTELPSATLTDGRRSFHLLDTPGIEGLTAESSVDLAVMDLLLDRRVGSLGLVVGARDLRRGILLALRLAEFEKPMVFIMNAADEARQAGVRVDRRRLEEILGVRVQPTVATEGEGVRALPRALTSARVPRLSHTYPEEIERGISDLSRLLDDPAVPARAVAAWLLEWPGLLAQLQEIGWVPADRQDCLRVIEEVQSRFPRPLAVVMAESRNRFAEAVLGEVVSVSPPARLPLAERIGRWARHPATGIPMAVLVVAAMYLFVGRVGAEWLVGWMEGGLFKNHLTPWVAGWMAPIPWPWVRDAVVGEFGLVSVGLTLALGIVLPVIVTFFFAFNVLEDSGYLARLSILLDRGLSRIGVGGRGLLPLVMGFSCITMALLTTRVLPTRKERIITSLLLVLSLPCAPLLSVMLVVLAPMPWTAPAFVFGLIALQTLLVGALASKVLPGEKSDFMMTVPPMRIPHLRAIARKTATRSWWFIVEAVPFFLAATFALFVLDRLGGLRILEHAARPVVEGWLRLPSETVDVLLMTVLRREAGAGLLKQLAETGAFTHLQIVITLLVMTFISPCVNSLLVLFKEQGWKVGLGILAFVTPWALVMGGVLHRILWALGVTFQ